MVVWPSATLLFQTEAQKARAAGGMLPLKKKIKNAHIQVSMNSPVVSTALRCASRTRPSANFAHIRRTDDDLDNLQGRS